jgi:hypothetical protein
MVLPDFQQNHMDVIERQALDQIMAEHNFNQSMYADPASAARMGRILGPSALVIVNVNNCTSEQIPLYADEKNFNGSVSRVLISKTRFTLEGSVRVVNLTTGQILGSHNFESKPEKSNKSRTGQPEFPPLDEVKDSAMQAVKLQVHAMFFPAEEAVNVIFYDDKDCELRQVYELYRNGDREGAARMMDSNLEQCKSGHKKDKTLARAYYDAGLLHCIAKDYDKADSFFSVAMNGKGAEAVAMASSSCKRAREGATLVEAYQTRLAQIPAPAPITAQAERAPEPESKSATLKSPDGPAASGPSAGSGAPGTVEERLKKVDTLYKRGLISKKEHDQKRTEILKDL